MKYKFPVWIKAGFLIVLFIIIAFGVSFYSSQKRSMRRQVEKRLLSIARLKVDEITAWRKERLNDGAEITTRPYLVEHLINWLAQPQEQNRNKLLIEFAILQRQGNYLNVLLVDAKGDVRLSLPGPTEVSKEYAAELSAAFKSHAPVMSELNIDPNLPKPHIAVVAPLFAKDEAARPIGAMILLIDPSRFLYPLIQSWPIPSKSAEALLVRRDGDDVLFLNALRHRSGTALKLRIPLSRSDLPAAMAIKGKHGIAVGRDYRGVKVISVLLPVPDSDWFTVTKIDATEAFAPWRSQAVLGIALFASTLVILAVLALFTWQHEERKHYLALYKSEAELRAVTQRHSVTLKSIGDAVIVTDAHGRIELLNSVAEALTGWKHEAACGRPLKEVFHIVNEHTRSLVENPVSKVMREGVVVGLANHTILIDKNGNERPIADSGAPIYSAEGTITGVVLVFRDQSEERAYQNKILESESFYRQTLESIPGMVFTTRPDGYRDYQSQQWVDYTGVPMSEHLGDGWNQLLHPEDRPRAFAAWRSAVEKDTPYNLEYRVRRYDGVYEWFKVIGRRIHTKDGAIVRWFGTALNIEALKQTEEALRQSAARFRAVFDQAGVGIARLDLSLRFEAVNPVQCAVLGYSEKELIGLSVLDLTHPDDRREYRHHIDEILAGNAKSFTLDKREIKKDGRYTWARVTVSAIQDAGGQPYSFISVIEDISDRKSAEDALVQLNATLEQNVAERTALAEARSKQLQALAAELIEAEERERRRVSILLHDDLQQMLAAARMRLESVYDSQPNEPTWSNVKQILEESIEKSRRLSHELSPPVLQHADLAAALQWITRHFSEQFGLQVELTMEGTQQSESGPLKVFVFRAVQELLFNVVKHAGVKKARVVLSNAEGFLVVTVSDQGRGIDPDILNSVTPQSGLGLLSLRERARHIGGNLSVESGPGLGCHFTLKVPFSIAKDDERRSPEAIQRFDIPVEKVSPPDSGLTQVLFVDDHKVMRQGLINLIGTQAGIRVAGEASNGREAIERVAQLKPDVVIMDVFMPVMDGIEATRQIKVQWPEVRVIALSMVEDEHISLTMREAGAEAFVSKAASSAELLKAIFGLTQYQ